MAPNDTLRLVAPLLNDITRMTADIEGQFSDSGDTDMQKRAQALQAHVAQFAACVDEELARTRLNDGEQTHE
jgi:hypothetical protein